ncbi:MAG: M1 family aminopeptidase [Ilumatobacteraceae bacterium]
MSTRRAALALAVAVVTVGACSGRDVHTDSAATVGSTTGRESPPAVTTTAPPTRPSSTDAPDTPAPTTDGGTATTEQPGARPAPAVEPSTSSGDVLYPELGSADLDVQSYDVAVSYDPTTELLAGTVTITTLVDRPLAALALDATDLTVDAVTVDGATASFEQSGSELIVRPTASMLPGREVAVAVTYHDDEHAADPPFGYGSGWYPTDGGAYVINEPTGARTWLPSNDHPSDKATWRFEITVPAGLTAVANGTLAEERAGDGTTTWVWTQADPMSTYLVQLLVGDYVVLDGGLAGTVPLTNVALAGDVAQMQPYFDMTADQMAFFEHLFGPYPLAGYGLAFSDSGRGLAMETQGRSLYSRGDFPGGPPGHVQQLFLSHELVHQWFGDAVSPESWSDLWLNESFATYGEWLWLDHAGFISLSDEALDNLQRRQVPTEPTGTPTEPDLFGYDRYEGGAVVVHALRLELGDDLFFALLQQWVADNDGTSRSTDDFIALAETVAGRDLDQFFADWLFAPALPAAFPG